MTDRLTILQGDCLEVLKTLPDESVHCCVTDPPYHLTTGKKGGTGTASVNLNTPASRARISTGFMGKAWDGGDVAFRPETWEAVLRVVKPGGYLLAFGGTRTFHRLACAIEDAGWELRDTIMWVYGSGFPKSLDVSKAIDKAAGVERPVVGVNTNGSGPHQIKLNNHGHGDTGVGYMDGSGKVFNITASATDASKQWEGWGTSLKPAWEPIIVARKPLIGTVAENVQEHGTGAMNIDGCRVAAPDGVPKFTHRAEPSANCFGDGKNGSNRTGELDTAKGRWPANLIHDGSDEVIAAFPQTESGMPCGIKAGGKLNTFGEYAGGIPVTGFGDSGSAARFFYTAKASKSDRGSYNTHPTVKPIALMSYLVRLVCPPGGTVLDPFSGSGSTGKAAIENSMKAILIDIDQANCECAKDRCNVTPGLPLNP